MSCCNNTYFILCVGTEGSANNMAEIEECPPGSICVLKGTDGEGNQVSECVPPYDCGDGS
jgi:hypothetical protein